jgi:homopolymeric O-antigen transport system ATP-binding protein
MSFPVIAFDQVSKSYPQYHQITGGLKRFIFNFPKAIKMFKTARYEALNNISFEVHPGEAVGIIGRNGAGKSTTLGLIAGVLRPTLGTVTVRGRISPLLELGAGFNMELTGRENIMLSGILMGLSRRQVQVHLEEIVEFSDLPDFIDQPIRTYSSGMLARLGFSVVSVLDPEILLIDEILSVGDIVFQKKCLARMQEFKKNKVTMVFVSHSIQDVLTLCDRVIWIENHGIQMMGETREVVQAYCNAHEASSG